MRLTIPLTLASTLLLTACATSQQDAQTAAPKTYNYACESGETIAVSYPDPDSARMEYQGTTYSMQIAVSGSGARYVGSGLEWWAKGSGPGSHGTLFQHNADDTTGERLESCTAASAR
ncbi:MliC family protein [Halomonas sp. M20]|uniref:MliC family protein n=1 Tax=Halomonas sp. M20 TaxID=2763264 RepID=UPI001D0A4736|nr:MliC family protein [Halomonas sp. M20]